MTGWNRVGACVSAFFFHVAWRSCSIYIRGNLTRERERGEERGKERTGGFQTGVKELAFLVLILVLVLVLILLMSGKEKRSFHLVHIEVCLSRKTSKGRSLSQVRVSRAPGSSSEVVLPLVVWGHPAAMSDWAGWNELLW